MSPRLPRVTARKLLGALKKEGWMEERQEGSHIQLKHPTKPGRVTLTMHPGDIVRPTLLMSILKQAGLTVDDLRRLL